MSLRYNEKAILFLKTLGFDCQPEPEWVITGRIPDFFCTGTLNMWVEVKSLAPRPEDHHLSKIFTYLRRYQDRITRGGHAIAHIDGIATEQHAKAVLNLTDHALREFADIDRKRLVVVVPRDPDFSERLHLTYVTTKGNTLLVTYRSGSNKYGYPYSADLECCDQLVTLSGRSGNVRGSLDQMASANNYMIAMRIYESADNIFRISGAMPVGPARDLNTSKRMRDAVQDGNRQIKNGLRYQRAPAALFLYQEGALVPADEIILASLFGDLEYVFQPTRFQDGRLQFGRNGALRRAHSSISATVFFRNEGVPLTVHNPWAERPLPTGLFCGREYIPSGDGTLHLSDKMHSDIES